MKNLNKVLHNKLQEKANKGLKLTFEISIDENDDSMLFDILTKYMSIMNDVKYEKIDRNVVGLGQSVKMAKFKGEHLKELINNILNTTSGKEIIKEVNLSYKEYFERLEDSNYVEQKIKQMEDKKPTTKKDEIIIHKNQSTIFDNEIKLETLEEKPRLEILLKKED